MLDIQMVQKVKVIYGIGSISKLGELVIEAGFKKAMVVCDKGVKESGIIDKVTDSLKNSNVDYYLFDKALPDAPVNIIEEGAAICKKEKCDTVIAVGGGSSIDTGKGINILQHNEGSILRFADPSVPMNLSLGLISIPTTSGTGSEVSDGVIVSNEVEKQKVPILAINGMSEYALVDPELMVSMPSHLTASTGMDTLAHLIEANTSVASNLFVDKITEKGIETVVKWLPEAMKDGSNVEARANMAVCCTLGGWMLGYGHTVAGHSIAHTLGSMYHIPHGFAVAYALPYTLEFNAPVIPEKTKKIGELMGAKFNGNETPEEIGVIVKNVVDDFIGQLGLKKANEFDYDEDMFPEVAAAIETEMFQVFNPRKMTSDDALEILKKIFA